MQNKSIPMFKEWVPEWLVRIIIFIILLSSAMGFFVYANNTASVMGYYGVEPADVQFSIVLMYASIASFLALDFRTIKFFTTKKYLLSGLFINALCYIVCFYSKNWHLFLLCRFILGIACALITSIVLNLIFPRLNSSRARVIAYSIFYAGLGIVSPLCGIYCSWVLHYFEFNWLFYGLTVLLLPVIGIVLVTMNSKSRIHRKIPLYNLDIAGYILYALICIMIGYICAYGQHENWFYSNRIIAASAATLVLLVLFISLEIRLKRPLVNLNLLKTRNVVIGVTILFIFYIFKSSLGSTFSYIEHVLGLDPLNLIPLWICSIAATVLSMFITSRFVLAGTSLTRLVLIGFIILGFFYIYMINFISSVAQTNDFILPIIIFNVAIGIIFVPAIIFTFSAAPPKIAFNTSIVGMFTRFVGFCCAIAINNYMQMYTSAAANEKFRESITEINPQLNLTLENIQHTFTSQGNDGASGKAVSEVYFKKFMHDQLLSHSTRDYYDFMLLLLIIFILILIFIPGINKVLVRLRKGTIPY